VNTIDLLRQQAPHLAERIDAAANESELQRLAWAAARAAVERAELSDSLIDQALRQAVPDEKLQAQVQALVEKLDDDYFSLKESLEEREDAGKLDREAAVAFSRARAASAVAEALGANAKEAAASAAYEAFAAIDDPQFLMDALPPPLSK
jgi:hypothetical protein